MAKDINYESRSIKRVIKKAFKIKEYVLEDINISLSHGKVFKVNSKGEEKGFVYVGRVMSCSSKGCDLGDGEVKDASSEYFDYVMAIDNNHKVLRVKIFNYNATHGHAVCARWWLKQFNGYDGSKDLEVGKNIDAVSGATKSSNALTKNIQKIIKNYIVPENN